ncbi:unnamed protein product [Protopolystoma xenopodis]|uniref:Uncharacterized protein n=1 Tax=Protopolystoma xenopodis TaxID=117903 RepID=A0A448WZS9_9PLAT|nr:unnamed protein product [Protopolystoma xenopodis]
MICLNRLFTRAITMVTRTDTLGCHSASSQASSCPSSCNQSDRVDEVMLRSVAGRPFLWLTDAIPSGRRVLLQAAGG